MGIWLCDVVNVKNELIRGGIRGRTFEEREANAMVSWLLWTVFSKNLLSTWLKHV